MPMYQGKQVTIVRPAKQGDQGFVERQNLNIRMGNRRMTRLTNAFSKKAANHTHMMAIYFMHYNFVRIHQTLKVTPAMAAGVTRCGEGDRDTLGFCRNGQFKRRTARRLFLSLSQTTVVGEFR